MVAQRNAAESSLLSAWDAMELMHVRNVSHDAALKEVEDCRGEIAALNNEKRS